MPWARGEQRSSGTCDGVVVGDDPPRSRGVLSPSIGGFRCGCRPRPRAGGPTPSSPGSNPPRARVPRRRRDRPRRPCLRPSRGPRVRGRRHENNRARVRGRGPHLPRVGAGRPLGRRPRSRARRRASLDRLQRPPRHDRRCRHGGSRYPRGPPKRDGGDVFGRRMRGSAGTTSRRSTTSCRDPRGPVRAWTVHRRRMTRWQPRPGHRGRRDLRARPCGGESAPVRIGTRTPRC